MCVSLRSPLNLEKLNHLYGEIFFEHSRNFEGYTVYISIESKTLAKFFKEMYDSQNRKYNIHNIGFEEIFLDVVSSRCTLLSCSLAY